jgi:hypothetical protein
MANDITVLIHDRFTPNDGLLRRRTIPFVILKSRQLANALSEERATSFEWLCERLFRSKTIFRRRDLPYEMDVAEHNWT